MIGHDREATGWGRISLLSVACFGSIFLLSGCGDFRRAIGMDRSGPDEFAVESRAPLTMPPDYELRPPQPGATRPQEVTAADRARKAIDAAGPGEPGKQANYSLKTTDGTLRGRATEGDTSQQVTDQSLASKLLGSSDSASGGTVGKRETTPVKGVY
jgi:hypothetical protein